MSRTSDDRFSVLQHVIRPQIRRPRPHLAYCGTHRSAAATRMAAIGSARGSVIGSGGCDVVRGGRVLSNSTRYCFGEQGRETAIEQP